ncbi:unnamed protein product [Symbiodinium microadriaticum]|nr:unnamed protein product [Symbiodinium microadriaticum]
MMFPERSETRPSTQAAMPGRSSTDPAASSSGLAEFAPSSAEVAQRSWSAGAERPNFKGKMDVLVAGGEDYERFIFQRHAQALGVENVVECCNRRDFRVALFNSQSQNQDLPCVVFLGSESWLEDFTKHDLTKRPPYVVNIDARGAKHPEAYHEQVLSSCTRDEITALLGRVVESRRLSDNHGAGASLC